MYTNKIDDLRFGSRTLLVPFSLYAISTKAGKINIGSKYCGSPYEINTPPKRVYTGTYAYCENVLLCLGHPENYTQFVYGFPFK